jgi:uncharacterized protein YcaQ
MRRTMSIEILIETARRYVLGRQGLWPGRRWRGLAGTEAAMRAVEHLQLDPLVVIARAHDLNLHSRVARFDSKLDRATGTLVINGLWLEDEALASSGGFADALGRGMDRFGIFLDAKRVDATAVSQPRLRRAMARNRRSARPR